MDKALLRGKLQTVKNNYALVQAGIALMAAPDALERIEETFAQFKDHPEATTFLYIRYVFQTDELLKHATKELRNSVLRNCLKETFEQVRLYGDLPPGSLALRPATSPLRNSQRLIAQTLLLGAIKVHEQFL